MPIRWIRGLLLTGLFVGACFEIHASNFETHSIAVQQAPTPKQECLVSKPVDVERHGLKPWYINADQTIWAYFWTSEPLKASPRDYKVLWIRPKPFPNASHKDANRMLASGQVGAEFTVSGRRIDSDTVALRYSIPSVYEQDIQPSSVSFPTAGCWKISAKSGTSRFDFIVAVE
jgi:hypothetical protein